MWIGLKRAMVCPPCVEYDNVIVAYGVESCRGLFREKRVFLQRQRFVERPCAALCARSGGMMGWASAVSGGSSVDSANLEIID